MTTATTPTPDLDVSVRIRALDDAYMAAREALRNRQAEGNLALTYLRQEAVLATHRAAMRMLLVADQLNRQAAALTEVLPEGDLGLVLNTLADHEPEAGLVEQAVGRLRGLTEALLSLNVRP